MRTRSANKRLFLLDYDGTLIPASSINSRPTAEVLAVLKALVADARNVVYIISGRGRSELGDWFESVVRAQTCPRLAPHRRTRRTERHHMGRTEPCAAGWA